MPPVSEPVSAAPFVVTGASGFVARHLIDRLAAEGRPVVALSRRGTARSDVKDVRVDDYEDVERLRAAVRGAACVFHLAARAHEVGAAAAQTDVSRFDDNVRSTVAVAKACRMEGVDRMVQLSSIGVNGNETHGQPFDADAIPRPAEPYAVSKWQAEQALAQQLGDGPTDYVIIRPPLVYGPGNPGNFARLLRLVQRAPLVPLGGFTARRTFVSVHNLVDALLIAATHDGASRGTFLVADDTTVSVAEVVRLLEQGLGRSPRRVIHVPLAWLQALATLAGRGPMVAKLAAELQVDARAFGAATGWRPPRTPQQDLPDMARRSLDNRPSR